MTLDHENDADSPESLATLAEESHQFAVDVMAASIALETNDISQPDAAEFLADLRHGVEPSTELPDEYHAAARSRLEGDTE